MHLLRTSVRVTLLQAAFCLFVLVQIKHKTPIVAAIVCFDNGVPPFGCTGIPALAIDTVWKVMLSGVRFRSRLRSSAIFFSGLALKWSRINRLFIVDRDLRLHLSWRWNCPWSLAGKHCLPYASTARSIVLLGCGVFLYIYIVVLSLTYLFLFFIFILDIITFAYISFSSVSCWCLEY